MNTKSKSSSIRCFLAVCITLTLLLTACATPSPEPASPPTQASPTQAPPTVASPTVAPPSEPTQAPAGPTALPAEPTAPSTPQACVMEGMKTFVSQAGGFCFAYPSQFEAKQIEGSLAYIVGPDQDKSADPLHAFLNVWAMPVPPVADLGNLVNSYTSQSSFQALPAPVVPAQAALGGAPAFVLDGVPGRGSSRQVLTLHGEALYILNYFPADPPLLPDFTALVEAVTKSFTFLSESPVGLPKPAPQTVAWLEFNNRLILTYDPALALWAEGWTVPAVPLSPDRMYAESTPTYAQIRFLGYRGGRGFQLPYPLREPQVMVFRTADFPEWGNDSGTDFPSQLAALQTLLQKGADPALCAQPLPGEGNALPFLPWVNARQSFCAQPQVINFDGGKGLRYLTHFSQGAGPIISPEVFYTFQGLTNDGQFYVSAVFPVETGLFPSVPPPCEKCGQAGYDPFPEWQQMLAGQITQLNALPGDQIDPPLSALDALVGSIQIGQP